MHRDLRQVPRVRALATAVQELFGEFAKEQAAAEARFAAHGRRGKRRER
jgi:hypothetical protein